MEYSLTTQAKNNQGRSDYVTPPVIVTTLGEFIQDGVKVTTRRVVEEEDFKNARRQ